jgi:hypothetical protein
VFAALQVFFEIGTQSCRYACIDVIIELCQKLRARHFTPSPSFLRK